jgi:hypothetical protein
LSGLLFSFGVCSRNHLFRNFVVPTPALRPSRRSVTPRSMPASCPMADKRSRNGNSAAGRIDPFVGPLANDRYLRKPDGFSHFVTSMTAPVASGWSVCRVGLAPTGKRRLLTAHTSSGRWGLQPWTSQLGGSSASRRTPEGLELRPKLRAANR